MQSRFTAARRLAGMASMLLLSIALFASAAPAPNPPSPERLRVVVLTDYFKDPDEVQAMVRFLTYANEFEIEGLIATSLAYGDGSVRPEWIVDILGDYGKVYDNLRQHERPGYPFPSADSLKRVVKGGAPMIRKLVGTGKGFPVPYPAGARDSRECEPAENWLRKDKISAGANHIISVVDRDDSRPVWVVIWGGAMDLAQAIWKVRQDRTPAEAARFIGKLRVHQSNWQDTGTVWIWNNVPELFLLFSNTNRGGLNAEGPENLRNETWIRKHLLEGHGPLAARYPAVGGGGNAKLVIKEGDSPTFLHLLAPGLSDPEQAEWGGWGGRHERFDPKRNHFVETRDRHPLSTERLREIYWTLGRWNEVISRDFAARLEWHVKDRAHANHPPVGRIDGDATVKVLRRTVRSGATLTLDAAGSLDPDDDALDFAWSRYVEPGTYRGPLSLQHAATSRMSLVAPAVSQPETVHIILAVTDRGEPKLTGYRRVVVTIQPVSK